MIEDHEILEPFAETCIAIGHFMHATGHVIKHKIQDWEDMVEDNEENE